MNRRIIGLASIVIFTILIIILPLSKKSLDDVGQEVLSTNNKEQIESPTPELNLPNSPAPSLSSRLEENTASLRNLEQAMIVKVVDGDTITVNLNGQNQTIRIIGINTPETVDPRTGVECFGIEASNKAKEYFKSKNYQAWLEKDEGQGERDKYQRLLRYVFADDGNVDYGLQMISQGYAYEYTYNTPYKYQSSYKNAQLEAQNEKRGLWADNSCQNSISNSTSQVSGSSTSQVGSSKSIEGDRDCKDFATQREAQDFFIENGEPGIDPHKLDSDRDGVVCESLP
ncbi:MAG: thermonuclease family protein [Patescibacteria group bacterium]